MAAHYFPLTSGSNWSLTNAISGSRFTFQVVSVNGFTYRVRYTNPWGTSDWALTDNGNQYLMTGYGNASGLMPLTNIVFLDFAAKPGTSWSNLLGAFSIGSHTASVGASGYLLSNCIQIIQGTGANAITMTFAPGIGIVSYSLGGQVFLLDTSTSKLPLSAMSVLSQDRPISSSLPPVGVVPNAFANEPDSMAASMSRAQMLAVAGARSLVGYGRWSDLEPAQNNFQLDPLRLQVAEAQALGMKSVYTFCIIDMASRNVPSNLETLAWTDPRMVQRVVSIVDVLAQNFGGNVSYFQFGNEADTYLVNHPNEVIGFAALLKIVRGEVQKYAPGVKVSVTLKFSSLPSLGSYLAPLNAASDLLALTYGPYNPDYTVESPSVVSRDFAAMLASAGVRKILLQEMAYPSSALVGSSQDLQSQFVKNVFAQLQAEPDRFAAANFYNLADYSPQQAVAFAASTGFAGNSNFLNLVETLGMFDVNGQPKKSWTAFSQQTAQPPSQ